MSELSHFRHEVDQFMAYHPQSPLPADRLANFKGLAYYPENESLVLELPVERFTADEPLIEMETSTGDTRPYRRWGRLSFTVDGEDASLTIYSDAHGKDFFLPFKDATNGTETYGAGRYLDNHRHGIVVLGDGRVQIDFNYCYNPYCTYSLAYSCPLPPRENWLTVPIRAGEKD